MVLASKEIVPSLHKISCFILNPKMLQAQVDNGKAILHFPFFFSTVVGRLVILGRSTVSALDMVTVDKNSKELSLDRPDVMRHLFSAHG